MIRDEYPSDCATNLWKYPHKKIYEKRNQQKFLKIMQIYCDFLQFLAISTEHNHKFYSTHNSAASPDTIVQFSFTWNSSVVHSFIHVIIWNLKYTLQQAKKSDSYETNWHFFDTSQS